MDKFDEIIAQYRMVFDHHTHTVYSHGKGTIEENVRVAALKGLKSIAITDHGPGHLAFPMKMKDVEKMRADIKAIEDKYPSVKVLLGVEANTIRRKPYLDISPEEGRKFDIVLAGYHFGTLGAGMTSNFVHSKTGMFGGELSRLKAKNTAMIVDALYYNEDEGNHISILTHPGDKGPFEIQDIARACQDTGTLIEINDKHHHLTVEEIQIASAFDVKFVISSDAHIPERVGSFEGPLRRALEAGLDPARIVNIEKI
ncbi:MAG: PHP domain-containing protein [Firmicutes bacterium]|nr:PHP domain-containing protein [Bacillota bacterium]MBQ1959361.1 PHP domain-containing protein [Bacillota bacterium]